MRETGWRRKKLIVFDLDGTLTPSKSKMDAEMGILLSKLLGQKRVAVIGGGTYRQFKEQFLSRLGAPREALKNLFLFPTTSTSFYRYRRGWRNVYRRELSARSKRKIIAAFRRAFAVVGYREPERLWGKVIEDRGTQITFSALGQAAPLAQKKRWNRNHDLRQSLMRILKKHLRGFEVRRGGLTSIDVTEKGIDKAYGVRQISKELNIPVKDMLFVGDALYPGGNDYAARRTGIGCVQVSGPAQAKKLIGFLLNAQDETHRRHLRQS